MAREWYRVIAPGVSTRNMHRLLHHRSITERSEEEEEEEEGEDRNSLNGSYENEVSEGEVSVPRQRRRISSPVGDTNNIGESPNSLSDSNTTQPINQPNNITSSTSSLTQPQPTIIRPICFDITARAYHGSTECNGYMYLVGGTADGREQLRTVSRVSIKGELVYDDHGEIDNDGRICEEFVTSMQEKRCYVGAVTCKGRVYAVGGFDGITRLSSVEYFEEREVPHTRRMKGIVKPEKWIGMWSSVASMNRGRSDAGVECMDG